MPVWEDLEWTGITWSRPHMKQRIMLIGDSITNGYSPFVDKAFENTYSVGKHTSSKAIDNIYLLKEFENMIHEFDKDSIKLIHFNNGIHGIWHLSAEKYQMCYDYCVQSLLETVPNAKLILALSTPLRKGGDTYEYYTKINDRILRDNDIVRNIAAKYSLETDDLYSVVDKKQEYSAEDGTHFNDAGYKALSEQVIEIIKRNLE